MRARRGMSEGALTMVVVAVILIAILFLAFGGLEYAKKLFNSAIDGFKCVGDNVALQPQPKCAEGYEKRFALSVPSGQICCEVVEDPGGTGGPGGDTGTTDNSPFVRNMKARAGTDWKSMRDYSANGLVTMENICAKDESKGLSFKLEISGEVWCNEPDITKCMNWVVYEQVMTESGIVLDQNLLLNEKGEKLEASAERTHLDEYRNEVKTTEKHEVVDNVFIEPLIFVATNKGMTVEDAQMLQKNKKTLVGPVWQKWVISNVRRTIKPLANPRTTTLVYQISVCRPSGETASAGTTPSKTECTIVESFPLKFKVRETVRPGGLTTQWTQKKSVTAACEPPAVCDRIYFQTAAKPSTSQTGTQAIVCPIPAPGDFDKATKFEDATRYCLAKDGVIQKDSCEKDEIACRDNMGSARDDVYAAAQHAFKAATSYDLLPKETDIMMLLNSQSTSSRWDCVKTTDQPTLNAQTGTPGNLYYVDTDPTNHRATFSIEHQSFEDGMLCVYGRQAGQAAVVAGTPSTATYFCPAQPYPIKIDLTPPKVQVKFHPATLAIDFACSDELSGCKVGVGNQYIGTPASYIEALVRKDTPELAAKLCPAYRGRNGYATETRASIQYNYNEIRVLCTRGEDTAGNAGVTMTTVYNAYDLIAKAIALELQREQKDKVAAS